MIFICKLRMNMICSIFQNLLRFHEFMAPDSIDTIMVKAFSGDKGCLNILEKLRQNTTWNKDLG